MDFEEIIRGAVRAGRVIVVNPEEDNPHFKARIAEYLENLKEKPETGRRETTT